MPAAPLLAFVALTGVGMLFFQAEAEANYLLTLAGALVMEASAHQVAGVFLGLSPFIYVLAYQSANWGWAGLCLVLGLGFRTLLKGGSPGWLVDGLRIQVPLACAALLAHLQFHPWLTGATLAAAFWLADLELPQQLKSLIPENERERSLALQRSVVLPRLGAVLLALGLAPAEPGAQLFGLLALLLLQTGFPHLARAVDSRDRMVLEKQLTGVAGHLEQSETRLAQTKETLSRAHTENRFLQEFATRILGARTSAETLSISLEAARQLAGSDNAAFFRAHGDQLELETYLGAELDLDKIRLARLEEPAVNKAWASRNPQVQTPQPGDRIFTQDQQCMAFPMGGAGVLYLGFGRPTQLNAEKHILLSSLAGLSGMALQLVAALDERTRALKESELDRQRLSRWTDRLTQVNQSSLDWLGLVEEEEFLDRFQARLKDLIAFDECLIVEADAGGHRGLVAPSDFDQAALRQLVEWVSSGKPVVSKKGEIDSPFAGHQSLVAVGAPSRRSGHLILILSSAAEESYSKQEEALLSTLSMTAGRILTMLDLHHQVVEALRKLRESESGLFQSSKLAAVGQLAAGVAHELNTPLGSVLMSIDLIAEQLEPSQQSYLEVATAELERAREIVAKLLTYSRPKSAGIVTVDLVQVVKDTLVLIGKQLKIADVNLETHLEGKLKVRVNPTEIQQIVINLLLNARDALEGVEQPALTLEARSSGELVELVLTDNGPGIPEEIAEKIFEPFFTTKPVGSGTGLGLSVSRELAEHNGGQLQAETRATGARFVLSFPAAS